MRICPKCGAPIPEKDKHQLCKACRKERRKIKRHEWWNDNGPWVAFLSILAGNAIMGGLLLKAGISIDDRLEMNGRPETVDDNEEDNHPVGKTHWNREKQRWEKEGEPYTYSVGWTDIRDGEHHEQSFRDIDNGYETYEHKQKRWWAKDVTWNHIAPDEN